LQSTSNARPETKTASPNLGRCRFEGNHGRNNQRKTIVQVVRENGNEGREALPQLRRETRRLAAGRDSSGGNANSSSEKRRGTEK